MKETLTELLQRKLEITNKRLGTDSQYESMKEDPNYWIGFLMGRRDTYMAILDYIRLKEILEGTDEEYAVDSGDGCNYHQMKAREKR